MASGHESTSNPPADRFEYVAHLSKAAHRRSIGEGRIKIENVDVIFASEPDHIIWLGLMPGFPVALPTSAAQSLASLLGGR